MSETEETPSPARHRGRPTRAESRDIALDLMLSAERCLSEKTSRELTLAEIAQAAGTTEAMIGYYFRSKEGLYSALIDLSSRDLDAQLTDLVATIDDLPGDPTRHFVERLIKVVETHAGVSSLVIGERLRQKSEVKNVYQRKYAKRGVARITKVITTYQEKGFYRQDIDLRYAALLVMTLASTRTSQAPVLGAMGFTNEEFLGDAWISYLTSILNSAFAVNPPRPAEGFSAPV